MANEITVSGSLQYDDGVVDDALSITQAIFSAAVPTPHRVKQLILTSETAINLGGIAAPKWMMLRNLDPTNYVDVKVAASGAIFAHLLPDTNGDGTGGFCIVPLGSGAQVPVAIANSGSCYVEVMICG